MEKSKIINSIIRLVGLSTLVVTFGPFATGCGLHGAPVGRMKAAEATVERGTLTGRVMRGPMSPVEGPGTSSAWRAAAGLRLTVSTAQGRLIQSVTTDEGGLYTIELPPGSYRLDIGTLERFQVSKDVPAAVEIKSGRETRYDIRINTGIR